MPGTRRKKSLSQKREANMPAEKDVAEERQEVPEEEIPKELVTVGPDLTEEDKEDLVLFPENHNTTASLLGVNIDLRPLPIAICKKLSRKIAPISINFEKVTREGGDAGDPELDIDTMDALVECVDILGAFYQFPSSLSKERMDAEVTPEDLLDFLKAQLVLNKENNFLLFNLRGIIRAVDLVGQVDLKALSANLPSTLPTADNGESASESSSTPTPADSSPS